MVKGGSFDLLHYEGNVLDRIKALEARITALEATELSGVAGPPGPTGSTGPVGPPGPGAPSPLTRGDLLVVDATPEITTLGIGAAQQHLHTNAGGTDPEWSNLVDLNGLADGLILDADGDTTLSAPTDDQIDVEVGGADVAAWKVGGLYHAAGGDVFPNNVGRGLAARLVNPTGLTAWAAHFRTGETTGPGNGTLAAYSWQGAPLGGTPIYVDYCVGQDYLGLAADGAGVKHFLSRAIPNVAANWQTRSIQGRFRTGITTEIGMRVDAGDDDNWVEVYFTGAAADATQRLDFRYRDNGGAITTVPSALVIPVDSLVIVRLLCYWNGAAYIALAYVTGEEGTDVNIAALAHTLTGNWAVGPPTTGRSGIFCKHLGNYGIVDWFLDEFV